MKNSLLYRIISITLNSKIMHLYIISMLFVLNLKNTIRSIVLQKVYCSTPNVRERHNPENDLQTIEMTIEFNCDHGDQSHRFWVKYTSNESQRHMKTTSIPMFAQQLFHNTRLLTSGYNSTTGKHTNSTHRERERWREYRIHNRAKLSLSYGIYVAMCLVDTCIKPCQMT